MRNDVLNNIRKKNIINIAVITLNSTELKVKSKINPLIELFKNHNRFNVIEILNDKQLHDYWKEYDLIFPLQPYILNISRDKELAIKLLLDNKIFFSPYAFDLSYIDYTLFKKCLIGCYKKNWLNNKPSHIIETGIPYEEILKEPKNKFRNLWKTNKKHILISLHWTIKNSRFDKSSLLLKFNNLKYIIEKYKDDCEFVIRPHPILYDWINNSIRIFNMRKDINLLNDIKIKLLELSKLCDIVYDNNLIDWFKYSDAMIHDCGSFKCEYLYMNKPVCYMANKINMQLLKKNHNNMCLDSIDCHELCWEDESLENFINNVLSDNDIKKDLRLKFQEKWIENYPNNKTPSENIINVILGQEEYKGLYL